MLDECHPSFRERRDIPWIQGGFVSGCRTLFFLFIDEALLVPQPSLLTFHCWLRLSVLRPNILMHVFSYCVGYKWDTDE